jgi:electron transport complex protein RnfE
VREVLGNGTLFGVHLFHAGFQPWVIMILPSGGFFTLAGWLLVFNWARERRARTHALAAEAAR